MPSVSVLMCVYNGSDCVTAAIDSILSQGFRDFEFVIVDDGSTDSTPDILKEYAAKDARIRIHTQQNAGLTKALNKGLSLCKAPLIARQDADDVSYNTRLQRQFDQFQNDPALVLCGSNADVHYDDFTAVWGAYDDESLRRAVFRRPPFPHSSAMFRKEIIDKLGGYDEGFQTAQDMELWMRMAKEGRITMIAEPLIRVNTGGNSISRKRLIRQHWDGMRARKKHQRGLELIRGCYDGARGFIGAVLPRKMLRALKGKSS